MRMLTILAAAVLVSFAVTHVDGNGNGNGQGHGYGHMYQYHDDSSDHDDKEEAVKNFKAGSNENDDSLDKADSKDQNPQHKSNLLQSIGHYHPEHPRHGCFKVARLLHCGLKPEEVKKKLVAILTTDSTQTLINFLNSLLSPKAKLIMKFSGLPGGTVEKLIQQFNGSPEDIANAKNQLNMFAHQFESFNFDQSLLLCQIIDIYETEVLRVQTKTQIHAVSTEDLKQALKKLEELEKHFDIKGIDFGKEHNTLEEKGVEGRPEVIENLTNWVDETDEWSLKMVIIVAATQLQGTKTVPPPTTMTTLPPTTLPTQPPTTETTQPPTTQTTQPPTTKTTQPPTTETTPPPTTETTPPPTTETTQPPTTETTQPPIILTTTPEATTLPPTTVPPTTLRPTAGPE